jgi:phosphoenolpyruvate synthase/pyruvate phosphate dikinase
MAIISLDRAHLHPLSRVGGKAFALGQLMAAGATVPPGFVLPPDEAVDLVSSAFDELGAEAVAVRSSGAGEDAGAQSWAGQFESYLYVPREQLLDRIAACRQSGSSVRAQAYDAHAQQMPVAVVVQAMVPADVAGVMFTANPVTRARDEVVIEAVYGLGEQLVQGLATPDRYIHHRLRGLQADISPKPVRLVGGPGGLEERPVPLAEQTLPALTPAQCRELARLGIELATRFGFPLDIEFAYHGNDLYIVQARPITTL